MRPIDKDLYNTILNTSGVFVVGDEKYTKLTTELYEFSGYLPLWENHIFLVIDDNGALYSMRLYTEQSEFHCPLEYYVEFLFCGELRDVALSYKDSFDKHLIHSCLLDLDSEEEDIAVSAVKLLRLNKSKERRRQSEKPWNK
jgi:hypothetical protein